MLHPNEDFFKTHTNYEKPKKNETCKGLVGFMQITNWVIKK